MQPIIPLQPYIREGEGYGSASYIPAPASINPIVKEIEAKREEKKLAQKEFNDDLIKLSVAKGDLLPEHQQQYLTKVKDLYDWYGKQRAEGKRVYDVGDPAYLEGKQKLAELAALAQTGKLAKQHNADVIKQKLAKPDDYEESDILDITRGLASTPLEKLDSSMFQYPEKVLNPYEYREKVKKNLEPVVRWDYKKAPLIPGTTTRILTGTATEDPEVAAKLVMEDTTPSGRKYRERALHSFVELPQKTQDEISKAIKLKNNSADPTINPELYKKELTKEMAKKSFEGVLTAKALNKEINDYEYQSEIKSRFGGGQEITPDSFTKTKVTIGGGGGREAFNRQYKTNYTAEDWAKQGGLETGETTDYVALAPKKGLKDIEEIQLSLDGKPFKPQGYKIVGDNVYATGALTEKTDTGALNTYGERIYKDKYVPKKNVPLSSQDVADVAAHYGFSEDRGGVKAFKEWIKESKEEQNATTPTQKKKETPAERAARIARGG